MISAPLSATDSFAPAFERMKNLLFKPFRFGIWWRLAILGLFTGELSGGGNFHFPTSFNVPAQNKTAESFSANPAFPFPTPPHLALWIAGAVAIGFVLMIVFLYVSSILRFVLFDSVLSSRVHIREGWRRWRERGRRFFVWQIGYMLISFLVFGVVVGIPVLLAWRGGLFRNPGNHVAALVLGGLALFCLVFLLAITSAVIYVLTKDFVIPIMAFEGLSTMDAWRRLWNMMQTSKGSYAGYLGFKLVLAIASFIALFIVDVIVLLVVILPVSIIGILIGLAGAGQGVGARAAIIAVLVVIGVTVAIAVFAFLCLLAVPVVVFFQSYSLHFFGSRYEPLRAVLYPAPPQNPPATPMGPIPEPAV